MRSAVAAAKEITMRSNETELLASKNVHEVNKRLAQKALESGSPKRCLETYKTVFLEAATELKDEAACEMLDLIEAWYICNAKAPAKIREFEREEKRRRVGIAETLKYFRGVYFDLPTFAKGERASKNYPEEEDRYYSVYVLPKTRKHIVSKIASGWNPRVRSPEGLEVFRFLIKAFRYREELPWKSPILSNEQAFKEGKEMILSVFAERCNDTYKWDRDDESIDPFYYWMCQENVPDEFLEVLAKKRAREGKAALAFRDGRNAEVLAPFCLEKRSETAVSLLSRHIKDVAAMDEAREALHDLMQPWVTVEKKYRMDGIGSLEKGHRQVGNSEVVVGNIDFTFVSDSHIAVLVRLPATLKDVTEDLMCDVFGRARRHIEAWQKSNPYDVSLKVISKFLRFKKEGKYKQS